MIYKILTIAKNTFIESIRQPVFSVIIVFSLFLFLMSPSITMYTLDSDQDVKLLREIGLSTLFLAGLFISIFTASYAVTEEIETKTITTVLAKPIGRATFIIGKYFGVLLAVFLAHYICTIAYLMVVRHGVLFEAADTHDWTVITAAAVTIILSVSISAFFNYIYEWSFPAVSMVCIAIIGTVGIVFLAFIDRDWKYGGLANSKFTLFDIYSSLLLLLAVIILVSCAVMFSTRFNIVLNLTFCIGIFLLGLISDWIFGRFADTNIFAYIGKILTPNLQMFWATDAMYSDAGTISSGYLLSTTLYALLYSSGIVALAVALFQRRQVG